MSTAATPSPLEDVQGDGRWMSIHQRFVGQAHELEPDVVFVGDSLLANLQATEIWESWFAPLHSLNLSIGGDQTQNILWRLTNGELECIKPKVVVILAGTNNHSNTAEEVADGIMEICKTVQDKQSSADIVLLPLLPRGEKPNPLREKHKKINAIIIDQAKKMERVQILNLDKDLVSADGSISHRDMFDYLHFTHQGYRRVFQPLHELLVQMLHGDDSLIVNEIAAATHSTLPSPSEASATD